MPDVGTTTAEAGPESLSRVDTVLDRLIAGLREKAAPIDGQERPVAVLWPDPHEGWRSLLALLCRQLPELLALGSYEPASRTGPAIWLRCAVEGALEGSAGRRNEPPVLYLPGVSRQQLRAGDDCPNELKPLVELLYRGAVWAHPNGREWTVRAFLGSPKSLCLDVADDAASRQAMLQALPEVAVMPLGHLRGRRLDADFFRWRLSPDLACDVLHWMGEGEALRARLGAERWDAFRGRCQGELGFDPQTEPDVAAGERLGAGEGDWALVWDRFLQTPEAYPQVEGVLRRARPTAVIAFERERWPDLNDEDEKRLQRQLREVRGLNHAQACRRLTALEQEHGARRRWVWARIGGSPMAATLGPLARLAAVVRTVPGGSSPKQAARAYVDDGWEADAAARQALAAAPLGEEQLAAALVRRLLLPWLQDSAREFQAAAGAWPLPLHGEQPSVKAEEGECLCFVDGLRYELGRALKELLDSRGLSTELQHRWAASPTVTACAKPAVSPVADQMVGGTLGGDFAPGFAPQGRRVDARSLRGAVKAAGYQVLEPGSLDAPFGEPARGWMEWSKIDTLGHELGAADFARRIEGELERLTDRVERLLLVGWAAVRVITDHGWLLMPGGLPKVDLPQHLTVSRGARCAVVAGAAKPDALIAPWHWNAEESFAAARGVGAFRRSVEYAHGGLSVQECLIPDLTVRGGGSRETEARIQTVTWRRWRCLVEVAVEADAVTADLRLKDEPKRSVAAEAKPVDQGGTVSLLLADDDHEHSRLVLVLVDDEGRILDRRETARGEDS